MTVATAGGAVTFAYSTAPWLLLSYYLRYGALAAFGAVVLAALPRRRRLALPERSGRPRFGLALCGAALAGVIALNGLGVAARIAPPGAVDMAFPLAHGTYSVLQGGNSFMTNPFHRVSKGERFAVDLVKLNAYGARASGVAPRPLDAYEVFDDSVFSPCEGVVVEAIDGVADNVAGRANVGVPAGNHVILRCRDVDVLLAHLRQGSVSAHPSERVVRRQFLGRVGNSGNTGEPHLHLSASRSGLAVPLTFAGRFLSLNSVWKAAPRPSPMSLRVFDALPQSGLIAEQVVPCFEPQAGPAELELRAHGD